MPDDPRILLAEVHRVVTDCERLLEAAIEFVQALPTDQERVEARVAAAEERRKQAWEEYRRLLTEDDVADWKEREAREKYERASSESFWLGLHLLGSDDIDPEHRKAIARQMAGLVREEAEQRLRDIVARSDDPELRSTVAEGKETVARTSRYVVTRFRPPPRELPLDEVRKAHREAREILDRLANPPVD
jgi:hypothetical protein